ncbi:MAG TPA: bifunctional DNA primase/polymerase [Terriglobales bacterium]
MTFLEIALANVAQCYHVHPLAPGSKKPITPHGKNDATRDEAKVREWWTNTPNANVGLACGPSNLCVMDCDHGLNSMEEFEAWRDRNNLPVTFTVRTGRRPEFGVQMYFTGAIPDVSLWKLDGCEGQIKSLGGYVCAAGSLHPSGEIYQVLCDVPLARTPDKVRQLRPEQQHTGKDGEPITENRNIALFQLGCKWRSDGMTQEGLELALLQFNMDNVEPPLGDDEVKQIAANCAKYDVPEPDPEVTIGQKKPVTDWRELFHTKEETANAPPISFLIDGFLQREGITGLAAPVRERKSLIALNVAHALVTGEKLFDYFQVTKKPERVLYLCPEMALGPFSDRLKKIGLLDHVGERLFYRTLSKDGKLKLDDEALKAALPGSVVILDTAVRFLKGDEDSSTDMRLFADELFALLRVGVEAVLVLYHSPKSQGNADMMTLENALRGSGDLGAALACCWGTRLQDITRPYESASYMSNLKQRDFESKDFEVTSGPDCRLHIVGDPETTVVRLQPRNGNKSNKDGKDDAAEAVIKAHMETPVRKLQEELAALGITRGTTWISKARARLKVSAA